MKASLKQVKVNKGHGTAFVYLNADGNLDAEQYFNGVVFGKEFFASGNYYDMEQIAANIVGRDSLALFETSDSEYARNNVELFGALDDFPTATNIINKAFYQLGLMFAYGYSVSSFNITHAGDIVDVVAHPVDFSASKCWAMYSRQNFINLLKKFNSNGWFSDDGVLGQTSIEVLYDRASDSYRHGTYKGFAALIGSEDTMVGFEISKIAAFASEVGSFDQTYREKFTETVLKELESISANGAGYFRLAYALNAADAAEALVVFKQTVQGSLVSKTIYREL